jgi:hypothetical protein
MLGAWLMAGQDIAGDVRLHPATNNPTAIQAWLQCTGQAESKTVHEKACTAHIIGGFCRLV